MEVTTKTWIRCNVSVPLRSNNRVKNIFPRNNTFRCKYTRNGIAKDREEPFTIMRRRSSTSWRSTTFLNLRFTTEISDINRFYLGGSSHWPFKGQSRSLYLAFSSSSNFLFLFSSFSLTSILWEWNFFYREFYFTFITSYCWDSKEGRN